MTERRGKKCKQINTYFNDKINGSSSYIKHNYTWYIYKGNTIGMVSYTYVFTDGIKWMRVCCVFSLNICCFF